MSDLNILITVIIVFSVVPWIVFFAVWSRVKKFLLKKRNIEVGRVASTKEVIASILKLVQFKKGAIFIIKQNDDLDSFLIEGTKLNADISASLLETIFEGTKTPLHDGAVVISGAKIEEAGSFITTLTKEKLPQKFGTRHRSSFALSENTDAIIIALSEETGKVTVFHNGTFSTTEPEQTNAIITEILINSKEKSK